VEHQPLDAEAARPRLRQLVLDVVEVAVVDVDLAPVDLQPGAAVEHPAAPAADLGHLPGPAQRAQVAGGEGAPVIDGEVPVAVRPVLPGGPGPAEGDRPHARQPGQMANDIVLERGVGPHLVTLGWGLVPGQPFSAGVPGGPVTVASRIPPPAPDRAGAP
jgi:hypothetical protein